MNLIKRCIVLSCVALLSACGGDGVSVSADFKNTQDIKEGALVYYEGEKIGEVSDVSVKESGSIVELDLKPQKAKKLAAKSAVVVNRLKKGAPLEIYNRVAESDEKLQSGQKIEGLDSMFQLGAWMVGDVIQTGTDSLSQYVGAFQEYLGSSEFEQSKAEIQKQVSDMTKSAAAVVKDVEQEVSSAINELSIDEEQIAQTIEQIGDELSPIISEVARSSTELVGQLEQFIVNIEDNANLSELQSGEKLLQSLTNTFEKLNESIEEGTKQVEIEK